MIILITQEEVGIQNWAKVDYLICAHSLHELGTASVPACSMSDQDSQSQHGIAGSTHSVHRLLQSSAQGQAQVGLTVTTTTTISQPPFHPHLISWPDQVILWGLDFVWRLLQSQEIESLGLFWFPLKRIDQLAQSPTTIKTQKPKTKNQTFIHIQRLSKPNTFIIVTPCLALYWWPHGDH